MLSESYNSRAVTLFYGTRIMSSTPADVLKTLFILLDCLIFSSVVYALVTDGLPFRKELLTPWMAATLVDFYIDIIPIAVWVVYKEPSWISAVFWIVLLLCLGSITTCTYIIFQLFKLSSQQMQDPFYHVLLRSHSRTGSQKEWNFSSVVAARILFTALGCLMLVTLLYTLITDGSPFRRELLTTWLVATLVDFYVNIVAIAVWITYKEASWISAFFWIVLLVCFGSITTCSYIVIQLFQSSQEPLYDVLLNGSSRLSYTKMNEGYADFPYQPLS